jgi:mannose-6-phosphate isomerase
LNGTPYADLSDRPLKVTGSRVWRTYSGGRLLERWKGESNPSDGVFPEEWIASTIQAVNAGREHLVEGLGTLTDADGAVIDLKTVIASDPARFLGTRHVKRYGANPAVLVKLIDSVERLSIQVHPDRRFAREIFKSDFGKTEAWYILGGRTVDGVPPYFLFGFKPGVTRETWKQLFDVQDIGGMLDALHKVPLTEGEVLLIEGGVPHAIGSGCFLIEIQEPTDYTLRIERTTVRGDTLPDAACHQGAGFDKVMDGFHYDACSYEETLNRWRIKPRIIRNIDGGKEVVLIGKNHTDRFRMHRLDVKSELKTEPFEGFAIAIATSGRGMINWGGGTMEIRQSDQLFIPASVGHLRWGNTGNGELTLVLCFPPAS